MRMTNFGRAAMSQLCRMHWEMQRASAVMSVATYEEGRK